MMGGKWPENGCFTACFILDLYKLIFTISANRKNMLAYILFIFVQYHNQLARPADNC